MSRTLDDMVLLYHRPSGQTHMIISPVPEILEALEGGRPARARDVLERLSRLYDMGPADAVLPEIAAHLTHMAALGLIRAVS